MIQNANSLSLQDVHRLLGLEKQAKGTFSPLLSLEPLIEIETQELQHIQHDFDRYLSAAKVSEGLVKFLALAPLLRLAGFYDFPIQLTMEDSITIVVEDEDQTIVGRLDILAVSQAEQTATAPFWILVIEVKNSAIDVFAGLPQLLTHAFKRLEQQAATWGLVTNGRRYLFTYLQQGTPPTYQLLPELTLTDPEEAAQLLQVLKAICKRH